MVTAYNDSEKLAHLIVFLHTIHVLVVTAKLTAACKESFSKLPWIPLWSSHLAGQQYTCNSVATA